MWYYLFIFFFFFSVAISMAVPKSFQGVLLTTNEVKKGKTETKEKLYTILGNNKKESFFDYYGLNGLSCSFPKVLEDKSDIESRYFLIQNQRTDDMQPAIFTVEKVEAYANNEGVRPIITGFRKTDVYPEKNSVEFELEYNCTNTEAWSVIRLLLEIDGQTMDFSYLKICDDRQNPYYFDFSLAVLFLFYMFFIGYLSRKPKMHTFNSDFKGVEVTLIGTLLYMALGSLMIALLFTSYSIFQYVFMAIFGFVSILAFGIYFNELLSLLIVKVRSSRILIQIPRVKSISILFIVGVTVALPLIAVWILYYNWIINDILTMILIGCCLRILTFKSLKGAMRFFIFEAIFEIAWFLLFFFNVENKSQDGFFSSSFNLPLKLECQNFMPVLHKKCSWVLINNLVPHGLLLSYFYRFDCVKNFNVYFIVSMTGFFFGSMGWIATQVLVDKALPQVIFTVPLMVIICVILSMQRNENIELWNGHFYDNQMIDVLFKSQDLCANMSKDLMFGQQPDNSISQLENSMSKAGNLSINDVGWRNSKI